MNNNNYLIVMAGGIGSRFWPVSTETKPKQFLDILGTGKSMIQSTVDRFRPIVPMENIYVVTNKKYRSLVEEQLPGLGIDQVLFEPCMRNTAPCIAYACYKILKRNAQANVVVAPSDHLITDESEFRTCILQALQFTASENVLLTLGIKPHRPETGYGYIQSGDLSGSFAPVLAFHEKPERALAEVYLNSGNYYWNSGIFVWRAQTIVDAFQTYLPEIATVFTTANSVYYTEDEQDFINEVFPTCESISIDYGIMEHAHNIFTMPVRFGWSDLGTWGSLWEQRVKSESGNSVVGNSIYLFECSDTIVTTEGNQTFVLQGLDNCIVAEANDVVIVCKKEEEQRIKQFREFVETKSMDNKMEKNY